MKKLLLIFLCFASIAWAETKVYVPLIDNLFTENRAGIYDRLFFKLKREGEFDWQFEYVPFNRAIKLFENSTEACIAIGNAYAAKEFYGIEAIDSGLGYAYVEVVFATLQSQTAPTSLADLENKSIAHLTGEDPENYNLSIAGLTKTSVENHSVSIKLLEAGRADYVFGASSDFAPFSDKLHYNDEFIVFSTYDTLTCKATENNRAMLERFRSELERILSEQTSTSPH